MKVLRLNCSALVTGRNSIEYLREVEFNRALVITGGQSMFKSGVIKKVKEYLNKPQKEVEVYSGIGKNPTTDEIKEGLKVINEFKPDLIVAVGGGSQIDAPKIKTLLYEYPD